MINIRKQLIQELTDICDNIRTPGSETNPQGEISLPMIVYSEIGNVKLGTYRDQITYQIDIYTSTFSSMIELTLQADAIMQDLGFFRTYTSPDTAAREGKDLYHKALSYTTEINLFTGETSGNFL